MKSRITIALAVLMISTGASAGEVMEKCVAVVDSLGSPDPAGQCTCFVDAMTDEQAEEYLAVEDWEADASDELKAIGVQCFPEIN